MTEESLQRVIDKARAASADRKAIEVAKRINAVAEDEHLPVRTTTTEGERDGSRPLDG